jgi:hypothetical protein
LLCCHDSRTSHASEHSTGFFIPSRKQQGRAASPYLPAGHGLFPD